MIALPAGMASSHPNSQVEWIVEGGGYGHGLGMSQWGAKGYADAGWNATQILQRYYSGITVGAASVPSSVRVGIAQDRTSLWFAPTGDTAVRAGSTTVATMRSGERWKIWSTNDGRYGVARYGSSSVLVTGSTSTHLALSWDSNAGKLLDMSDLGNKYRWGPLELNVYGSGSAYRMRAILLIAPFDRYLYGLGEVPSSWPAEALKAQVIAARTYAVEKITRLGQNRVGCNCALSSTTNDQAYVGYSKEEGSWGTVWKSAVDATAGKLALYQGQPIQAYYSSSSGGYTESNEYVWGGSAIPYLRGVRDDGDVASPNHAWSFTYTPTELQSRLNAYADTAVGTLTSIETLAPYGVSGRVLWVIDSDSGGVRIAGSGGTKRVSGERLRSVLGLKSTKFRIRKATAGPDVVRRFSFSAFSSQSGQWVAAGKLGYSPRDQLVTGLDREPLVRTYALYDDGRVIRTSEFNAYDPRFTGGVRVASGNVDAATTGEEIVTAPGPGMVGRVRIWTLTGGLRLLKEFDPFGSSTGGVTVAVANTDGTGPEEIVVGQGKGGSRAGVYRFASGKVGKLSEWIGYGSFTGGIRVAAGDVDADGKAEVVTAPGPGGTPNVRIWRANSTLVRSWLEQPGSGSWTGGTHVGAGDVDGDRKAEVVVSYDGGTGPTVKIIHPDQALHVSFIAYAGYYGGVRLGLADWNGDGRMAVVTGTGPNGSTTTRVSEVG